MFELEVLVDGEVTDRLAAEGDVVRLGRDQKLEIWLPDPTLSKHHATIRRAGEAYTIEDAGSTNGTFVNDQKIARRSLNEGDVVRLGSYTLRFQHGVPLWMRLRSATPAHGTKAAALALGRTYAPPKALERSARERSSPVTARLAIQGRAAAPIVVDRDVFLVGSGDGCHLRLRASGAPRVAAVIVRGRSGWQLVPTAEGVRLEEQVVRERLWLRDGDRLELGELTAVFRKDA